MKALLNPVTVCALAYLIGALPALIIVASIAFPAVWSRNHARRNRAKDTLGLLAQFFSKM